MAITPLELATSSSVRTLMRCTMLLDSNGKFKEKGGGDALTDEIDIMLEVLGAGGVCVCFGE